MIRERAANEQEKFETQLTNLEGRYDNTSEWFTHKLQELEIKLETAQEEIIMNRQQQLDTERARQLRI